MCNSNIKMIKNISISPIVRKLLESETTPSVELLNQILSLPKQNLINEIESVLNLIIDLSDGYEQRNLIPLHCLFILTELESEDSLPLLLKICSQSDDFLEFYFEDLLTDSMWQDTLVLGKNNVDTLFKFIRENNLQMAGCNVIADGLSQIALHMPHLRNRIITDFLEIYIDLFKHNKDYVLNYKDLIRLTEINAIELDEAIKLFVKDNRVEDYEIWKQFLVESTTKQLEIKQLLSIKDRYKLTILPEIQFNKMIENLNNLKSLNNNDSELIDNIFNELLLTENSGINVSNLNINIGRNDFCFCGSGKKYKKCCMKK